MFGVSEWAIMKNTTFTLAVALLVLPAVRYSEAAPTEVLPPGSVLPVAKARVEAGTVNAPAAPAQKSDYVQNLIDELSSSDPSRQRHALSILVDLNIPLEWVLPVYHKLLSSKSETIREVVANLLGEYGEKAQVAVPDLLLLLQKDDYENVSVESARALAKIAPQDPTVIAAFTRAAMKRGTVGLAAIESLGETGPAANAAAPSLVKLLSNQKGNIDISSKAFDALGRVVRVSSGVSVSEAVPILNKLDTTPIEKIAAAFTILREEGGSVDVIPVLVKILNQRPEPHFKYAAIRALGKIGPGSDVNAVRTLVSLLSRDPSLDPLAEAAERAIELIGDGDLEAVVPLAEALSRPNPLVRRIAATALIRIGPAAKSATPALLKALQKELHTETTDYLVVNMVAGALASIGPRASGAATEVLNLLNPTAPFAQKPGAARIRPLLFGVLAAVGVPQKAEAREKTLQRVLEGLQSSSRYERGGAARVAGLLGTEAAPAVPHLIRMLDPKVDDSTMTPLFEATMMALVRPTQLNRNLLNKAHGSHAEGMTTGMLEAIRALGRIGATARAAIPTLNRYALSKDGEILFSFYREDALEALRKIEAGGAAPVLPVVPATPRLQPTTAMLGKVVPNLSFADLEGKNHQIANWRKQVALFVFVDTSCPCVLAYKERLKSLDKRFGAQGLRIIYVFSSPQDSEAKIKKFLLQHQLPGTRVFDEHQSLLKLFDVHTTSESFLLDRNSVLRYGGRIDDNIYNPKSVKDRSLEMTIQDVSYNRPVTRVGVPPRSCVIARL